MAAKVVHLNDRRPDQRSRDDQTIDVFQQPLTDWNESPTDAGGLTNADKQSNNRK